MWLFLNNHLLKMNNRLPLQLEWGRIHIPFKYMECGVLSIGHKFGVRGLFHKDLLLYVHEPHKIMSTCVPQNRSYISILFADHYKFLSSSHLKYHNTWSFIRYHKIFKFIVRTSLGYPSNTLIPRNWSWVNLMGVLSIKCGSISTECLTKVRWGQCLSRCQVIMVCVLWGHHGVMLWGHHGVMFWGHHHVLRSSSCYEVIIMFWGHHHVLRSSWCHVMRSSWCHVLRSSSCYEVIIMLWGPHHVMRSSSCSEVIMVSCYEVIMVSCYEVIIMLWGHHHVMRSSSCSEVIIMFWGHHGVMLWGHHGVMFWGHHHVMRSSSCYEVLIMLWGHHHVMRSSWCHVMRSSWCHVMRSSSCTCIVVII